MAKISGAASGVSTPVADEHIPEMLITAMCHQNPLERVVNVSLMLLKEPSLPLRDRLVLDALDELRAGTIECDGRVD
jgi:hypothetical protein